MRSFVMEGKHADIGLTEKQGGSYAKWWYNSFSEKGGDLSIKQFDRAAKFTKKELENARNLASQKNEGKGTGTGNLQLRGTRNQNEGLDSLPGGRGSGSGEVSERAESQSLDAIRNKFSESGFGRSDRYARRSLGGGETNLRASEESLQHQDLEGGEFSPDNDSILKKTEATNEDFRNIKFTSGRDLIDKASFETTDKGLKINLEGQEFIRRMIEESDIRTGKKRLGDENVEASFSGLFRDDEQVAQLLNTLKTLSTEAKKAEDTDAKSGL